MAINKLFGPVKSDSKNFINLQEKHPRQSVINKAGLPGSVFPIKEYFPGKFMKLWKQLSYNGSTNGDFYDLVTEKHFNQIIFFEKNNWN